MATAGVGIGPSCTTSMPTEVKPDTNANSIEYPESRVSLPMTTRWRRSPFVNMWPAAMPTLSAMSGRHRKGIRLPPYAVGPEKLPCHGQTLLIAAQYRKVGRQPLRKPTLEP